MTRALAELQAEAERKDSLPCRIYRLWPNDLPADEVHKQGFYWAPLDPCRMRPEKEKEIFLGLSLSDAKNTLLKMDLPKESSHATP